MLPYLSPLKNNLIFKIFASFLIFGIFSALVIFLLENYLNINNNILIIIFGIFIFVVSILMSRAIANYALRPLDFLVRSVLISSNSANNIDAPRLDKLPKSSSKFINEVISKIYDLGSDQGSAANQPTKHKSIASTMPMPVLALNNKQEIIFANEEALKYIEQSSEDIINKPLNDVISLSFSSMNTLDEWLLKIKEKSVVSSETWQRVRLIINKDRHKNFDLIARYSQNDPSGIETILAIYDRTVFYDQDDHDLTFIALAVHELRTPLTILRGYIELFESELGDKLDSEQKSFMHNMNASAQQLTSFASNILNVVRIEDNNMKMILKEENYSELIKQICSELDLRARVHGKKITLNIEKDLPKVAVDRASIYEVIVNLIENAIKYTHTDEEISVDVHAQDGLVETTVTDKGVGIPSNVIDHVFDKFYRSHSSKNSVGGSGLGLFLSKSIVLAHGGNIWVKSKEDQGSTFGFTLIPYSKVAGDLQNIINNKETDIVRGAHGWIKNHSLYKE